MKTKHALLWIWIQTLVAGPLLAQAAGPGATAAPDRPVGSTGADGVSPDVASSSTRSQLEPWMSNQLPAKLRRGLADAFPLAVDSVREQPACRVLFEELGADGSEALARSLYYGATLREEQGPCRKAAAFTSVGSRVTRLCRSFGRLSDSQAAVVLIHEALHHAGMTERPRDPQALDSSAINELVSRSCAL